MTNPYGMPPWGPYNFFGGYPTPPPSMPPIKDKSPVKQMMDDMKEWQAWEEFQKRFKKEEPKKTSKLSSIDWFMILCALNSITVPLFIIIGVKIFH